MDTELIFKDDNIFFIDSFPSIDFNFNGKRLNNLKTSFMFIVLRLSCQLIAILKTGQPSIYRKTYNLKPFQNAFDRETYLSRNCLKFLYFFLASIPEEEHEDPLKAIYISDCKKKGRTPVSNYLRHFTDKSLHLSHLGLGPRDIKIIAQSLVVNFCINSIIK